MIVTLCTGWMFALGELWNMPLMMSVKWLMLLLAVSTEARLQDIWRPDDSFVGGEMMMTIFETCYKHHKSVNPIIIIGEFKESIDEASIIRMDDSLIVDENYKPSSYNGATKVILIEHSLEKLQSDLELLRKTQWWDHMSVFFIIGNRKEACSNFKDIIMTTWQMDIINAVYICPESTNTAVLYTLNPITNYAPYPWEKMEEFNDSNIYRQTFDPRISCKNLNYDKTIRLNGYRIHAFRPPTKKDQQFNNCLISALNATWEVPKGFSLEAANLIDIDIIFPTKHAPGRKLYLFPYEWHFDIAIVKTDQISTLEKIYKLWSPEVLYLAIISLIIFLLILVVKNDDIVLGILDAIRFLTYVAIRTNIRNHSFRIYFTTMLILIVISNGVFQGKIASFLTKPDRTQPVKTVDELIALGYKFFAVRGYTPSNGYHNFRANCNKCTVIKVNSDECIDFVLNGTKNACLVWLSTYETSYMKQPLESIEETVMVTYWHTLCRKNWPLYDRAYHMSMILFESGLYKYWEKDESYYRRLIREADNFAAKLEDIEPRYRPVKLNRLDFAFELLVIGLSLATLAFVFEWIDATYLNP